MLADGAVFPTLGPRQGEEGLGRPRPGSSFSVTLAESRLNGMHVRRS
jgi:hypothetical protein